MISPVILAFFTGTQTQKRGTEFSLAKVGSPLSNTMYHATGVFGLEYVEHELLLFFISF